MFFSRKMSSQNSVIGQAGTSGGTLLSLLAIDRVHGDILLSTAKENNKSLTIQIDGEVWHLLFTVWLHFH
jgi:hypothetical protein